MDAFDKHRGIYALGEAAYWGGVLRTDNPYTDEQERQVWFAGYDRAKELDDEDE